MEDAYNQMIWTFAITVSANLLLGFIAITYSALSVPNCASWWAWSLQALQIFLLWLSLFFTAVNVQHEA